MNWSAHAWPPSKSRREIIADPNACYDGAQVTEKTLLHGNNAGLGETRFEAWLIQQATARAG
jgi:hypothetical protein